MKLDPDKYRQYVDNLDLSDEDKLDLMRQVWAIMESFVDRAFGESPEQFFLGKFPKKKPKLGPVALNSKGILTPIFNQASAVAAEKDKS